MVYLFCEQKQTYESQLRGSELHESQLRVFPVDRFDDERFQSPTDTIGNFKFHAMFKHAHHCMTR